MNNNLKEKISLIIFWSLVWLLLLLITLGLIINYSFSVPSMITSLENFIIYSYPVYYLIIIFNILTLSIVFFMLEKNKLLSNKKIIVYTFIVFIIIGIITYFINENSDPNIIVERFYPDDTRVIAFNSPFEYYEGTQTGYNTKELIREVKYNNEGLDINEETYVTINYEGQLYSKDEELQDLVSKIKSTKKYNISLYSDNEYGLITIINIENIKDITNTTNITDAN